MFNFDTEHSKLNSNLENPPILRLPSEILDHCWSYLRRRDLFQVSGVSRVFWYTSRSRIFQSLNVTLPSLAVLPLNQNLVRRSTNKAPKMLERAATRITSFYSDPSAGELWDMVQDWTVSTAPAIRNSMFFFARSQEKNLASRSVDAIFPFLTCSRNLRSLELVRVNLGRQQWIIIECLPALDTLRLISCLFPPSSHLERPLKLKELAIAGDNFGPRSIEERLVSVLCNPTYLQKLTLIDFLVTHTVLAVLSSMAPFPHLTYLSIFVTSPSRDHFFRFLAATPALATLRIFPWSANITPPHPLPPLSSLRSYDGYPNLLSYIVPGRPVDCVCLVLMMVTTDDDQPDYAIHTELVSTVRDISRSTVPVRKLAIEYFLPTLDNLAAIAKHLPDLHRLDLGLISGPPPLTPVSVIFAFILCNFVHASLSPQEEIITLSESSSEFGLDYTSEPLDTVDTMQVRRIADKAMLQRKSFQGLLSWLAEGRAPLPPKLVTLRLSHSLTGNEDIQCAEGVKQRKLVRCLHSRYPTLREVEMGGCRWWREGVYWSREILEFEET
ncbi:uncharacterized protein F5147DRAFT_701254 [Suillus discolor]|uniref:F-box domain-containing protein n=1 Tax=Suillus discolor TaxID=1912936 RepID=A0A9P7F5C9_9AGAM|nr:uncharacterized protein F5147DRAFT_701254 [Suillus discolor]KAG2106162.1 hypothetical protein F5147DRAFT_701254 [Suillus discolor]